METVSFDDFKKLDIRIGTVVRAEVPEWSHWVMKLTVDFDDPSTRSARSGQCIGRRTVFAGIMKFFKSKDLEGKQFAFIVNLEPKKIGPEGDKSEGMMLMAVEKDDEETPPVFLSPKKKVSNGTKIM